MNPDLIFPYPVNPNPFGDFNDDVRVIFRKLIVCLCALSSRCGCQRQDSRIESLCYSKQY